MKIELSKPFASNGKVDELDVRQLKKALNRLGYYQPRAKIGITAIPDTEIFTALKKFQKAQNLRPTGSANPNDETIQTLNEKISKQPDGYYIWRTVGDEKVRGTHAELDGTMRAWSDAPDPGDDFNCRCWAESVEEGLKPVYPELLLVPLLRVGRLYNLWRLWLNSRNTDWILGSHKSATRWGNQLRNRDWTPEQITEAIKHGKQYKAPNKVNRGNTATTYEYKGRYVVRDDQTKEILQISEPDFIRPIIER